MELGFPLKNWVRIGKMMFRTATVHQLAIVAIAMILAWTVSEINSIAIGPNDKENNILMLTNKNMTKYDREGEFFVISSKLNSERAYPRITNTMEMARAPYDRLPFLPRNFTIGIAPKHPTTATMFMKIGNNFSNAGMMEPTISPEYAIIEPIPTICCWTEIWKARNTANLLFAGWFFYWLFSLSFWLYWPCISSISISISFLLSYLLLCFSFSYLLLFFYFWGTDFSNCFST